MELPQTALQLLESRLGPGNRREDYPLEKFVTRVPKTRMKDHELISTDPLERLNHAHGQSLPDWIGIRGGILKRFPDGVAYPGSADAVRALMHFAHERGVVVIPFGGGTSVVGHLTIPEEERPVLSLSLDRLCRLKWLDSESLLAGFETGVKGPELEANLRAHGLTLGHFPQSFEYSSLGGWVMTRSCGQQSMHYGRIEDLFAGGELVSPKGVFRFPAFPGSAAGPDLRHLVLGSEGRLGVLTEGILRVSPLPAKDVIYAGFFPSWDNGVEAVRLMARLRSPISMIRLSSPEETETNFSLAGMGKGVALLKRYLVLRGILSGDACMCLIGLTGTRRRVTAAKREILKLMRDQGGVFCGKAIGNRWKQNRFRAPYLRNSLWSLGYAVDTLETAVSWDKVSSSKKAIERALCEALKPRNERALVFTHLSHVYATGSSVYTTFLFRLASTPEESMERWLTLKSAASRAIVKAGGTITHQHGVGVDHRNYMEEEKGALGKRLLEELCAFVDPDRLMNPAKLVD
jgi:alkyldihydroxyacetonephosphate synthase